MECKVCGATIDKERLGYVGGQGYTGKQVCEDETACWARYDRQNGLTDTPASKEMDEKGRNLKRKERKQWRK